MREEEEQKEKLEELEDKLEKALERIEELEDGFSVEEEASQQDSIHIDGFEGAPFRVHWVQPGETGSSCSDIDTVKKAQEAFAAANAARNADGHRVMHGDVLVLMCNYEYGDACYYVGLCVVTNTPNQLSVPDNPDITEDSGNKEFMAWYTCPGENENCDCDDGESIPELTSEGDWDDWHVSLGSCIRFTDLMNLEVYQSDSEGTDLKAYTREITLNKCGEIISISEESETTLSIPCCDGEGGCDDDFLNEYKLTDANGNEYTLRRISPNCSDWYSVETFGNDPSYHYWSMHKDAMGDFAVTGTMEYDADGMPTGLGYPCDPANMGPKSDGNDTVPTGTYRCVNNFGEPQGTIATVSVP